MENAKEIVKSFLKALNAEDFETARKYVSDNMKFIGVLGSRDGADAYFEDMKKMKLKYDIKKTFGDISDVCVLYDVTMSGISVFSCGWYQLEDNKINVFKVVFDPRPVLELAEKK